MGFSHIISCRSHILLSSSWMLWGCFICKFFVVLLGLEWYLPWLQFLLAPHLLYTNLLSLWWLYEVFPHSSLQTEHYFRQPQFVAPQLQAIFHETILMNVTAIKLSYSFQRLCSWRSLGIFLLNIPPCCNSSSRKPLCSVLTTACFCNPLSVSA